MPASVAAAWLALLIAGPLAGAPASPDWHQWGGPGRDFAVPGGETPVGWPGEAPAVVWRRPLGPGYSAIVSAGGRLFTMTRRGGDEVVVALSPQDGRTLWEHAYPAPIEGGPALDTSWGEGPNGTPLVHQGRVFALGFTGVLSSLDAATGELVWRRDLRRQDDVAVPFFGLSTSPVRFGDTLIVIAGGALAVRLDDGEPVWRNRAFDASYASPRLWQTGADPQLVVPAAGEIVGLDPRDGRLLWRHEHANSQRTVLSDPLPGADRLLFASAYFLGSIALELAADGASVRELWQTRRLQLAQSNAHRVGDVVYGFHNSILVALDVRSGEVLWRSRDFERANLIRVGDRFLLFDRLGRLSVVSLGPEGAAIHAAAQILEGRSWTAPTLVGSRLYARNLESIVAVDLSRAGGAGEAVADRPALPAISAPEAFLAARERLTTAHLRAEAAGMEAAAEELHRWTADPEIGHLALYYRGFAAYQQALLVGNAALPLLRVAETLLKQAARRQPGFADAHALLARVYPMYYRFDPRRAAVVGSLGDDHLETALRFEPDNPRVLAIQGLDLIHSPPEYGGDPEAGLVVLRRALDRFAEAAAEPPTAYPDWGHAAAWVWFGEALLERGAGEREEALAAFRKALELAPDLAAALSALDEASGAE